jgi:hypothetical protein
MLTFWMECNNFLTNQEKVIWIVEVHFNSGRIEIFIFCHKINVDENTMTCTKIGALILWKSKNCFLRQLFYNKIILSNITSLILLQSSKF